MSNKEQLQSQRGDEQIGISRLGAQLLQSRGAQLYLYLRSSKTRKKLRFDFPARKVAVSQIKVSSLQR
jgi:hypothetical protein